MSISTVLSLLAGGLVTGTLGTLLGIGGGIFLIPFLVLVLHIPMHQAIATSIIAVIATSSAGAAMNVEHHRVHLRLGMLLEIATVSGAILGGFTANVLSGDFLKKVFSTLLLVVAAMMIYQVKKRESAPAERTTGGVLAGTYVDDSTGASIPYSVRRVPLTMLISLVAGNVSGLLGVGGGIFKVPTMNLISGLPMKVASATSNFMIGVTAAASAFIYLSHGHMNPLITASATLGIIAGSYVGVQLFRRIRGTTLTWLFALLMILVSIQMYVG